MLECLDHDDSAFITLTYEDEFVPVTDEGLLTLKKDDLTRFFKRLRMVLDYPIKYYACGEYGDKFGRPHFHAIVFGLRPEDWIKVSDNWKYGFVKVGDVELASANYVAGYIQKKLYGDLADEVYDGIVPPYSVMSKGIGERYLRKNYDKLVSDGYIMFHGKKLPIPRTFWYYAEKDHRNYYKAQTDRMISSEKRQILMLKKKGIDISQYRKFEEKALASLEYALSSMEKMKK